MRLVILTTVLSIFVYFPGFATPKNFHSKLEITKTEDGQAAAVLLRSRWIEISLETLLEEILLDFDQIRISSDLQKELSMEKLSALIDFPLDELPVEYQKEIRASVEAVRQFDPFQIKNSNGFQKWVKRFREKVRQQLDGYRTIARPDTPRFYHNRRVVEKVTKTGAELAHLLIGDPPILGFALFIVDHVSALIKHRRAFYQYYVLHYLDTYPPETLGLTQTDVNHIRSSIFESKIKWSNFIGSYKARKAWQFYGSDHFDHLAHTATKKATTGIRLNFIFQNVLQSGNNKIFNLTVPRHLLSSKPSLAFDLNQPQRVAQQRKALRMIHIGSRLIPMPGIVSTLFDRFIVSTYLPQAKGDGALLGLFETSPRLSPSAVAAMQTMNPFIYHPYVSNP